MEAERLVAACCRCTWCRCCASSWYVALFFPADERPDGTHRTEADPSDRVRQ